MDTQITDYIDKKLRFIPIKKYRQKFKHSILKRLRKSYYNPNHILEQYAALTTPTKDREKQKELLKKSVRLIEIEIASFCNRKCWFCPNSMIDRKTDSIELPEDIYLKIIHNLAEIDYSGQLNFHRFNEPLANKDLILKRVRQAKEALPNATLGIFTNGDYLDREYLDSLRNAGITAMIMSYYFEKNKEFDVYNIIRPGMDKMAKKLNLEYREIENTEWQYAIQFLYEGMNILYRAWNPRTTASDRGGSLTDERIMKRKRNFPCFYPLREIFIDYNGQAMPCCNTRSDVESHKNLILGNIQDYDLFALFMNEKFIAMRKDLMQTTPKYSACVHCFYNPAL